MFAIVDGPDVVRTRLPLRDGRGSVKVLSDLFNNKGYDRLLDFWAPVFEDVNRLFEQFVKFRDVQIGVFRSIKKALDLVRRTVEGDSQTIDSVRNHSIRSPQKDEGSPNKVRYDHGSTGNWC